MAQEGPKTNLGLILSSSFRKKISCLAAMGKSWKTITMFKPISKQNCPKSTPSQSQPETLPPTTGGHLCLELLEKASLLTVLRKWNNPSTPKTNSSTTSLTRPSVHLSTCKVICATPAPDSLTKTHP